MSKKKSKNSDYRYLQRKEDERKEAVKKAEQKKNKAKDTWIYVIGLVLLLASVIMGVYAYTSQNSWLMPYYCVVSAVGMFLLGLHYRDKRDKYSKVCVGFGIGMLVLAFLMFRGTIG